MTFGCQVCGCPQIMQHDNQPASVAGDFSADEVDFNEDDSSVSSPQVHEADLPPPIVEFISADQDIADMSAEIEATAYGMWPCDIAEA
jgi:hypothetical protein